MNNIKERGLSFFLLYLHSKSKIHETLNLLLEISLIKEYSIMAEQENFQQGPVRLNCKQLQKVGLYSVKCHNHSPLSITNFSH